MLTANRFDEIKKAVQRFRQYAGAYEEETVQAFGMLGELADEIDRLRTPAQAAGRGHVKPVVLDAQGKPVLPKPIAQQFAAERRAQYEADRLEAITMTRENAGTLVERWRVFALRWGLAPPPGGWGNEEAITNVIHAVRLGVKAVSYVEKHFSAVYLTSRGIALPPGVKLVGGVLTGVDLPDEPAA